MVQRGQYRLVQKLMWNKQMEGHTICAFRRWSRMACSEIYIPKRDTHVPCRFWPAKCNVMAPKKSSTMTLSKQIDILYCPPLSQKHGDLKSHLSVCPLISSEVLKIEHWYLACMILVISPFKWHHAVTLTFDLLQGQSCCRAGDHNSPNMLVTCLFKRSKLIEGYAVMV